jgi:hypothetical protein
VCTSAAAAAAAAARCTPPLLGMRIASASAARAASGAMREFMGAARCGDPPKYGV